MKSLGYPDDAPLFPGDDCQPLQHHQTVEIFRSVIEATGTTMTRNGPNGTALQRFCEHVCRVSGAQMLTRRGFPLDTVQLLGRWGSDAIKVYVQETPLQRGPWRSASPSTGSRHTRTDQRNGRALPRDSSTEVLGGQHDDEDGPSPGSLRDLHR